MNTITPEYIYFAIAVAASTFFGLTAPRMFRIDTKDWNAFTRIHQFWLNFAGSFAGWVCLWLLWQQVSHFQNIGQVTNFGSWEIFLAVVAFIGITGYLPLASVQLIQNLGNWLGKLGKPKSAAKNDNNKDSKQSS